MKARPDAPLISDSLFAEQPLASVDNRVESHLYGLLRSSYHSKSTVGFLALVTFHLHGISVLDSVHTCLR
ncbi:hypothetical protein D918_09432 [Trichuris suis]|nr:hypothetical protein D918_09432 [Trichuris suis]